ncbi:MAG: lytic transglycosylase domain-containing protein [Desulfuromusa sp.]|jgi:soluble lytic murein transglycosylase-like protein|nr:lytic transglycosylase domain-containing protein [Desulfuromusa sp.]
MFMLFRLIPVLVLLTLMLTPAPVQAGIYRHVDEHGRVHFTNVPTTNKFLFYRSEGEKYQLESLITHFAEKFQLDRSLLKAVIKVESNFNPQVVSIKGAQGLMQLMPETAREVGVNNPFDPSDSIYGGSLYLRKMLDYFDLNLDYALAAYNAGPNAVRKYGGIPPFEETQNYVKKVKHYFDFYSRSKDNF